MKRVFDVVVALVAMVVLLPVVVVIGIAVRVDSSGHVFFCQSRVTQYGRQFRMVKFRTMIDQAQSAGPDITVEDDSRVTRVGKLLRRYRLDEIPQLLNIILGDMSFVGPRPEIPKYVERYTDEMRATLLVPAGLTSEASIRYRNEDQMLSCVDDVDEVYIGTVLPRKMELNLRSIERFSLWAEAVTMIRTVVAVLQRDQSPHPAMVDERHTSATPRQ